MSSDAIGEITMIKPNNEPDKTETAREVLAAILTPAPNCWPTGNGERFLADAVIKELAQRGFKIMPREPTEAMQETGQGAMPVIIRYWQEGKMLHAEMAKPGDKLWVGCEEVYRAMWDAAPMTDDPFRNKGMTDEVRAAKARAMGEVTEEIKRKAFAAAAPFFDDGEGDHFDAVSAALEAVVPLIAARERARGVEEAKNLILNGRFLTEDAPVHKWAKEVAAMLDRHLVALSPIPANAGHKGNSMSDIKGLVERLRGEADEWQKVWDGEELQSKDEIGRNVGEEIAAKYREAADALELMQAALLSPSPPMPKVKENP